MKLLILAALILTSTSEAFAAPATYAEALQAARESYNTQQYAATRVALDQALDLARTVEEKSAILLRMAQLSRDEKDEAKARERWAEIIALEGAPAKEKIMARVNLGGSLLQEKKFEAARELFAHVIADKETEKLVRVAALMALGGAYHDEKRFEEARRELEKVASDAEAETFIRVLAGQKISNIYFEEKNFALARAALEKVRALPNLSVTIDAMAVARIIEAFRKEGNDKEADSLFARYSFQSLQRAIALSDDKRHGEARNYYFAALVVSKPGSDVSATLTEKIAETYISEGNFDKGREELQKILAWQPPAEMPERQVLVRRAVQQHAQWTLALSYIMQKEKRRAVLELEKMLQMPQLHPALKTLAQSKLNEIK